MSDFTKSMQHLICEILFGPYEKVILFVVSLLPIYLVKEVKCEDLQLLFVIITSVGLGILWFCYFRRMARDKSYCPVCKGILGKQTTGLKNECKLCKREFVIGRSTPTGMV